MDNLFGKVLGGVLGAGAKGVEKALVQLDRHGTSEHAKVGDERRADKKKKMEEASSEAEKIEENLDRLTLKLERLFIDFNYAGTIAEKEKARVAIEITEREINRLEERIIRNQEKINGKPITKVLKDFFTKSAFSERVKISRRSSGQKEKLEELKRRSREF